MKTLINKKTKKRTLISDKDAAVMINSEVAHLFTIEDIKEPIEVVKIEDIKTPIEAVQEKEKPKKKK